MNGEISTTKTTHQMLHDFVKNVHLNCYPNLRFLLVFMYGLPFNTLFL